MQFKIDSNISRGRITTFLLCTFFGIIIGFFALFQYISEPYTFSLTNSIFGFIISILSFFAAIIHFKFRAVTVTDDAVNIRLGFSNKTYPYSEILEIRYASKQDDLPRGIDKEEVFSTIIITTADHDALYLTCENDIGLFAALQEQFENSKQR